METGYQRGRIQDESMQYEHGKHDGSIPLVGVNTFRNPDDAEKQDQLLRLHDFQSRHADERDQMLDRLQRTALDGGNVFAVLMDAAAAAPSARSPRRCSRSVVATAATSDHLLEPVWTGVS